MKEMRSTLRGFEYRLVETRGPEGYEVWKLATTVEGTGGFKSKVTDTIYLAPRQGWCTPRKRQGQTKYKWDSSDHALAGYVSDVLYVR
jgi:hypothetical protein